jgi:hypothetical protein
MVNMFKELKELVTRDQRMRTMPHKELSKGKQKLWG